MQSFMWSFWLSSNKCFLWSYWFSSSDYAAANSDTVEPFFLFGALERLQIVKIRPPDHSPNLRRFVAVFSSNFRRFLSGLGRWTSPCFWVSRCSNKAIFSPIFCAIFRKDWMFEHFLWSVLKLRWTNNMIMMNTFALIFRTCTSSVF